MNTPKLSIELPYPIKLSITEPENQLLTWQEALIRISNGLPVDMLYDGWNWKSINANSNISIANLSRYSRNAFRISPTTVTLNIA